ncbi:MAG: DNA polymerase IV [Pseudomonadota bacterium]
MNDMIEDSSASSDQQNFTVLCRDCSGLWPDQDGIPLSCSGCGSTRLVAHPELTRLSIGHIDCDSFFAAVEKRDRPELLHRPVLIGGRHRGVVAAACYIARIYGVHSAMPMFEAERLCPDAVILPPDLVKYRKVGHMIRTLMQASARAVEPLSIDEAYVEFDKTRPGRPAPCQILAALIRRIESETGIHASVGLSYNKMLAKLASDLDKPRGFSVIGQAGAKAFLAPMPVTKLWGVGPAMAGRLKRMGIDTIGQIQPMQPQILRQIFGQSGQRISEFANAKDTRKVAINPGRSKTVSVEQTFDRDLDGRDALAKAIDAMVHQLVRRVQRSNLAGRALTLKLRDHTFQIYTRTRHFADPTLDEAKIRQMGNLLLDQAYHPARRYRLVGLGFSDLEPIDQADPPNLLDML